MAPYPASDVHPSVRSGPSALSRLGFPASVRPMLAPPGAAFAIFAASAVAACVSVDRREPVAAGEPDSGVEGGGEADAEPDDASDGDPGVSTDADSGPAGPPSCTKGDLSCDETGAVVVVCTAEGTWQNEKACNTAFERCSEGSCVAGDLCPEIFDCYLGCEDDFEGDDLVDQCVELCIEGGAVDARTGWEGIADCYLEEGCETSAAGRLGCLAASCAEQGAVCFYAHIPFGAGGCKALAEEMVKCEVTGDGEICESAAVAQADLEARTLFVRLLWCVQEECSGETPGSVGFKTCRQAATTAGPCKSAHQECFAD